MRDKTTGRPRPVLTDTSGAPGKYWRAAIQLAAGTACASPLTGPLVVTATFILQQVWPGAVVNLHDGIPPSEAGTGQTRQATVDAVATILPRLVERYECVTASSLLESRSRA